MRLEVARFLHRDDRSEGESHVRDGVIQHVAITVGKNGKTVATLESAQRLHHVGEGAQRFDLSHQPLGVFPRVSNTRTVHYLGNGSTSDLPIERVATVAQGIDHGVLEMRAPPPGDELM